jgi:hypothetical protein
LWENINSRGGKKRYASTNPIIQRIEVGRFKGMNPRDRTTVQQKLKTFAHWMFPPNQTTI